MSSHAAVHDPNLQHHFHTKEQQLDASKLGMWLFLATEILLFGGLFAAYFFFHEAYPETFQFFPLTPDDASGVHIATPDPKTPAGASLSMMEVGGPIVGIGSTLDFC